MTNELPRSLAQGHDRDRRGHGIPGGRVGVCRPVYSRESTERPLQTSGLTGFADGEFSVEVCGATWTTARTVADAIVAAVQNFTGTAYGSIIDHVQVSSDRDGTAVYLTDGQDLPSYFVIELQLFIRWSE